MALQDLFPDPVLAARAVAGTLAENPAGLRSRDPEGAVDLDGLDLTKSDELVDERSAIAEVFCDLGRAVMILDCQGHCGPPVAAIIIRIDRGCQLELSIGGGT